MSSPLPQHTRTLSQAEHTLSSVCLAVSPPCRQPCMGASIIPPVKRRRPESGWPREAVVRQASLGRPAPSPGVWLSRSPQARPPDIWRDPLSLRGQAGPSLLCSRGGRWDWELALWVPTQGPVILLWVRQRGAERTSGGDARLPWAEDVTQRRPSKLPVLVPGSRWLLDCSADYFRAPPLRYGYG